jgi:hypothetical protein
MNSLAQNVDAQSVGDLLTVSVELAWNDETWLDVLGVKEARYSAPWLTSHRNRYAESHAQQRIGDTVLIVMNAPARVSAAREHIVNFNSGILPYANLQQSIYLIPPTAPREFLPSKFTVWPLVNPFKRWDIGWDVGTAAVAAVKSSASVELEGVVFQLPGAMPMWGPEYFVLTDEFPSTIGEPVASDALAEIDRSGSAECPTCSAIRRTLANKKASIDDEGKESAQRAADEACEFANRQLSLDHKS